MARSSKRTFGTVRRLASGRFQARYSTPDGRRVAAPVTFGTRGDAETWLITEQADVVRGVWMPPTPKPQPSITLRTYSDTWLPARTVKGRPLRPRTLVEYRKLLDQLILPGLGSMSVTAIRAQDVRAWYATLSPDTPTRRAHAYSLLRSILASAVDDQVIATNPCRIRGAGQTERAREIRPATAAELHRIADASRPQDASMVLLAGWCSLRLGEVTALRRCDVDIAAGTVTVARQVQWVRGQGPVYGPAKSRAGHRTVAIPPHVVPPLRRHLTTVPLHPDALLFPAVHGGPQNPKSVRERFAVARQAAGREDMTFHSLRHTGQSLSAMVGASLPELMSRAGQSTPAAALRYLHAAADRDRVIADALSTLVDSDQVG